MLDEVRWGIIGCGDVTEVKSGPALRHVEHSRLVAVMRRDAAKAADYAWRHGVPRWYDNAEALLDDPEVNAVYVATPPDSHEAYTIAALQRGKPVYVEKPVALNAASARRMAVFAESSGLPLSVAHYRRAWPMFRQVGAWLEAGSIGPITHVTLTYRQSTPDSSLLLEPRYAWRMDPAVSGGGLFHDLAPHALDLIYHWFGEAEHIQGLVASTSGNLRVPDTVSAQMRLASGMLFSGNWCFAAPAGSEADEVVITGTKGQIRFAVFAHSRLELLCEGERQILEFERLPHVQEPMIAEVIRHFRGLGPNPCSPQEAVKVMEWIDRITEVG